MGRKIGALALSVALLAVTTARAEAPAYPAALIATSETEEASRFTYDVREQLKASHSFRLVDPGADGFRLRLATMEMGGAIAYSVVVTFTLTNDRGQADYFISHTVGGCGRDNYPACAETVVAHFSEEAEAFTNSVTALVRESQKLK